MTQQHLVLGGILCALCVSLSALCLTAPGSPLVLTRMEADATRRSLGKYYGKHYTEILRMLKQEQRAGGVIVIKNQSSRGTDLQRMDEPPCKTPGNCQTTWTYVSVLDDGTPQYIHENFKPTSRYHRGIIAQYDHFLEDFAG